MSSEAGPGPADLRRRPWRSVRKDLRHVLSRLSERCPDGASAGHFPKSRGTPPIKHRRARIGAALRAGDGRRWRHAPKWHASCDTLQDRSENVPWLYRPGTLALRYDGLRRPAKRSSGIGPVPPLAELVNGGIVAACSTLETATKAASLTVGPAQRGRPLAEVRIVRPLQLRRSFPGSPSSRDRWRHRGGADLPDRRRRALVLRGLRCGGHPAWPVVGAALGPARGSRRSRGTCAGPETNSPATRLWGRMTPADLTRCIDLRGARRDVPRHQRRRLGGRRAR
ncbi:hypothetical protein ROA7023_03774 [Roseisalinus antarcticus]|uniref:Uncharacterized protein n=1 Tax=Roseisalinus antarcticus TaxID=254357 RepID=A0A1Y5TVY1_9RHOB|nr:hypothetical protein ROA7023_03774 [Roseisalinus antarcticus]